MDVHFGDQFVSNFLELCFIDGIEAFMMRSQLH